MAIRSFQQIIDAHEAAQAMLRSLEVDVRDTMADAKAELERFRLAGTEFRPLAVGDRLVCLDATGQDALHVGGIYTLVVNPRYTGPDAVTGSCYKLAFVDDNHLRRVLYNFWFNRNHLARLG